MENLIISKTSIKDALLLEVEGTINSYTYNEFEEQVYSAIKQDDVVLNLAKVKNMSSSGLGVLMSAYDDGEENGHSIFILNPSDIVRLAIDSTGFSDMFKIIRSLDEL